MLAPGWRIWRFVMLLLPMLLLAQGEETVKPDPARAYA